MSACPALCPYQSASHAGGRAQLRAAGSRGPSSRDAEPLEILDFDEETDYALIGPADNRVHEVNTDRFPYSAVCHLGRDFGDNLWRGCSGALIGPRRVLTAAHCLHSLRLRRAPVRVRVVPGRGDRDRMPFGTMIAAAGYVPRQFLRPRSRRELQENDYGVLLLPRPFPGIDRFLNLRALSDAALRRILSTGKLTVSGYPADRPIGTQWRHSEHLRRFTRRRLLYTMDTCPGHSGSPVWTILGDAPVVVGIHTSGILDERGRSYGCAPGTILAPPGLLNSGVRITAEIAANILDPQRGSAESRPMVRVL